MKQGAPPLSRFEGEPLPLASPREGARLTTWPDLFGQDTLAQPRRPSAPLAALPGDWPFGDLHQRAYGVILADPPWRFENFSEAGEEKAPQAHYACMDADDIAALPVDRLAAVDCVLVMWATAPMLDVAFNVMAAWGFTFKTAGAWHKRTATGRHDAFGTGYIYRSAMEPWLVGTKGAPDIRVRDVRNLIVAPIREHSRKPDQMRHNIARQFHGPYAELFARERAPGWDAWGNQVGRFGGTDDAT